MTEQETLYMMALTRVPALNLTGLHVLIEEMGSATAVYENRKRMREVLSSASQNIIYLPRA